MLQHKSYLKQVLTAEEYKAFEEAIAHDNVICSTLIKVFKARGRQADKRDDLLDDVNYMPKRAYLDGRLKELSWFTKLLTEGDSDNE